MIQHASRATFSATGRRTRVLAAVLVGMAMLLAACGPYDNASAPGCPGGPSDAITATIMYRTNSDRAATGLGPLVWNPRLACLATEWSTYMATTHDFNHRDLNTTIWSPGFEDYSRLGENILVGPRSIDGNQMQDAWLASPHHYRVIMGDYDSVGIGYAYSNDGGISVTVNLGRHY